MGKNIEHVQHVKSNVVIEGKPKLPSASILVDGELAINYAEGVETISIKNSSGDIVTFSSDNYYSEQKLGSAFTDENSGVTVTSVVDDINERIDNLGQEVEVNSGDTPSGDTIEIWIDESIDPIVADVYTKAEINSKLGSAFTGSNSGVTITDAIDELDEKKLDASAYTPTDLSNYYTKSETSGATEISTALSNKANSSDLNAYADSVKYNETTKYVEFYHGTTAGTKVYEFDASDFIIDGMVDDVRIEDVAGSGTCLVIDFNTASGKQDINIPLTQIFDPSNYYNKTAIDNLVGSGFTLSSITDVIIENEQIVSASLTDLDDRKLDASAYTPTEELWVSGTGLNSVVLKGSSGTASGDYSVAEGYMTTGSGIVSHAEGGATIASGQCSHAEGIQTKAFGGFGSHAEGRGTIASGESSHAEGRSTGAVGVGSHSEGIETAAHGDYSHAEGNMAHAMGNTSHAEGSATFAYGDYSHTEGVTTFAYGAASHTEGYGTRTSNDYEHASGKWNISNSATTEFGDSGNTLFSVGNGTADDARHNAFEIRQNGDIYIVSGGTDIKLQDNIGKVAMPTTYSAETYTSSTITSSEPVVYALVRYTGTTALANQVCPVTLADGQQCNVIYQSANNNAYDAVISTDYVEPDGQAITLNVPAGGYAEINYINIKGIIFVRGI